MEITSRKEAKERGLKHYFTGKPCKRGHIEKRFVSTFQCVICSRMHLKKNRKENPEKFREYDRKRYYENRAAMVEKAARWQKENPERYKEIKAGIYQRSKQEIYKKMKERRDSCPKYKCALAVRRHLDRVLRMTKQKKTNGSERMIGYSSEDFRLHMERNFLPDMTWGNHGTLWHIGHIIPVAEMVEAGIKDPKKINALKNLIPEYAEENLSKGREFALSSQPVL